MDARRPFRLMLLAVLLAGPLVTSCAALRPSEAPDESSAAPASMEAVYQALVLEDLVHELRPQDDGFTLDVSYDWVNRSETRLVVPPNTDFTRPYYVLGAWHEWVERLDGAVVPGAPSWMRQEGARYSIAGGVLVLDFVPGRNQLRTGERIPVMRSIDLASFPAGRYRFTVEYERLVGDLTGDRLLGDWTIEFELP